MSIFGLDFWDRAARDVFARVKTRDDAPRACFCVGPQNGQPLCPCRMRNVEVRDGRYVEIIDHGPAA